MKLFLYLFIASVGFILILLVASFFLPGEYSMQKDIFIKAPPDSIFNYVKDLRNWQNWSGWSEIHDSTVVYKFNGISDKKGALMSWKGEKMGSGQIVLTSVKPYNYISYDMLLQENKFKAKGSISIEDKPGGSAVTWSDRGKLNGPLGKLMYKVFKKDLEKNLNLGLKTLKKKMETKKAN